MHHHCILRLPRGYNAFCDSPEDAVPDQGMITLVQWDVPAYGIALATNLQALAVRVEFGRAYTICNLCLHSNRRLTTQDLQSIINQLPQPYVIIGNFNSRHHLWGDNTINQLGCVIETLLIGDNICLNTGEYTHLHIRTAARSGLDLSLCSPEIAADLE